jgi:predicted enzyme related to lactoylglutathione lyase
MASNRVVHFEILAERPQELTQFYGEVFGWRFEKAPLPGPEYWLCNTGTGEPGINGAIMARQHAQQPWMNYVGVASIDAVIERATRMEAKVALPRTAIPGVGAYAAIMDPQGNICGQWEETKKA